MNVAYWVQPTYDVQFPLVRELGLQVEDVGVLRRAWGLSERVRAALPEADDNTVAAQFRPLAQQAEETGLASLASFRANKPFLDKVPMHRFFPTVFMQVAVVGETYDLCVTLNSRAISPMVYERFIAFLYNDEVEAYQTERTDIPGHNYRFDID